MCNHTVHTFSSNCGDCLDSLYDAPQPIVMKSSFADGAYVYTNAHGAETHISVVHGQACLVGLQHPGMGVTLDDFLADGGGSVKAAVSTEAGNIAVLYMSIVCIFVVIVWSIMEPVLSGLSGLVG